MIRFTTEQVLLQHHYLMLQSGGMDGLRDEGLLESALNAPFQTFAGQPLYPSIQQKAVRLCCSMIENHPFIDGNKRIGVHLLLLFLEAHGISLAYEQEELVSLGLSLAAGQASGPDVLEWIRTHWR